MHQLHAQLSPWFELRPWPRGYTSAEMRVLASIFVCMPSIQHVSKHLRTLQVHKAPNDKVLVAFDHEHATHHSLQERFSKTSHSRHMSFFWPTTACFACLPATPEAVVHPPVWRWTKLSASISTFSCIPRRVFYASELPGPHALLVSGYARETARHDDQS